MAIELITGLPGNAKTLYMIGRAIQRSTEESRPVFYSGIKGFQVDDPRLNGVAWTEIDPLNWHTEVPSGAIIVIDEAQKVFRARTLGAVPPKHVTELEEHRHKGLDFLMTTQHPGLVDPAIRKLAQVHRHMVRIWNMEASTVHTWNSEVRDNCDKPAGRRDSEKVKWAFNKKLYGIYHSADAHTMKRTIPGRVKLLGGLILVAIALIWYVVSFVGKKATGGQPTPGLPASSLQYVGNGGSAPASRQAGPVDPVLDAKNYVWRETPRVTGLPQTAPKYDGLTVPVRVPVPAACIQIGSLQAQNGLRCKCYSQQGTPMQIEMSMCLEFARNGFFQDFDAERDRSQVAQAERGQDVMRAIPDAARPERQDVGRVAAVTVIPNLGDPPVRPVRVSADSILGK